MKFTWSNGNVYEGDYVDNKRTGKGKMDYYDGTVYVGEFLDGKRSGKGILYNPDKSIMFSGMWESDHPKVDHIHRYLSRIRVFR